MNNISNTFLGIISILAYIQIRLIKSINPFLPMPSIKVWVRENDLVKSDIALLTFVWLHLGTFLIWSWIGLAVIIGFEAIVVLSIYAYLWVINHINKAE